MINVSELRGKYVYLAGPYAIGHQGQNVRNITLIADSLMNQGVFVFNPLLSHFHQLLAPRSQEFWYAYDLKWLEKCEVMLFMPGESKGVDLEIAHAIKKGIPVYRIEEIEL